MLAIELSHFIDKNDVFVASDFWHVVAPEEALLIEPAGGEVDLVGELFQEDVLPEAVTSNNAGD